MSKKMRKKFFALFVLAGLTLLFSQNTYAIVDMKDANYSESWTDLDQGGPGYILKVVRTYESRSIYDGMFGFGWCSNFETKLEITPDSNIKVIECGGGMETTFAAGRESQSERQKLIATIVKKVRAKRKNSGLKESYFKNFAKELNDNKFLREAFAEEFKLKGSLQKGKVYTAVSKSDEKVLVEEKSFKRILSDGTFQKFNSKGQLIAMYDKSLNFIKISYAGSKITSIVDNNGRRLSFKYYKSNGKVKHIISSPVKKVVTYTYKSHDLVAVNNAWSSTYSYAYDDLHNLERIKYPDSSTKEIKYNKDKDWVTAFKDRRGCTESYVYRDSEDDPRNHYWSEVVKKCKGKVTNKSKYEFWHKERSDKSGKYLARVKSEINGVITDVKYHETLGLPIFNQSGTQVTLYSYYPNGNLRETKTSNMALTYFYDDKCGKIKKLVQENILKRKVASKVSTIYKYYTPSCNLRLAANTNGESVQLLYDKAGRVIKVVDHTKKLLRISYNSRTGKPAKLTRPGLGSLSLVYDDQGKMVSTKSAQGAEIGTQVANVFNTLLKVIGPASEDISI